MATQSIDSPVEVRDNGVRSFIPPSFCFDLRSSSGGVVATVSQIVLTVRGNLEDFGALDFLNQNELLAVGSISEYDAGAQAREPGRRFTVTGLMSRHMVSHGE